MAYPDRKGGVHETRADALRANAQYDQADAQMRLAETATKQSVANRAYQDKQNYEQSRAAQRQQVQQENQAREDRQREQQLQQEQFRLDQQQAYEQRQYQDEMAARNREMVAAEQDK